MTGACIGLVAVSKAGRDKGRAFVVVGIADEAHVLVSDGALRRLERPKRKKLRHLTFTDVYAEPVAAMLASNARITDADVRGALERAGFGKEPKE